MTATVAVLGPGAVGGALAVHLSLAGQRVVCVARRETAEPIIEHGLTLELGEEKATAWPEVVELLGDPVDLLLVTVKAPALDKALGRVTREAVADGVVVSLLNGLEHIETTRGRLGAKTAAGSVSRFQAYRDGPAHIVQLTETLVVTVASDDLTADELAAALEPLKAAGVDVRFGSSERAVLWEKAARLGPLAAVTALSQLSLGEVRAAPEWREMLAVAIEATKPMTADDMADLLARNRGYGGGIANMLKNAPDLQKLHYINALRNVKEGWSLDQRKAFYGYLSEARSKQGGARLDSRFRLA